MSDTPDLGKIVSLIMENPDLIARIQDLAKRDEAKETVSPADIESESVNAPNTAVEASDTVEASRPTVINTREKRNRLLCAMKPYLSSERAKAIDSMMSVAEILDMMKPR